MWLWCRLRGGCKQCPNTAWLLFLLFAIGMIVLVSISVYLSKKRLNLAVLGIGIVRARRSVVSLSGFTPPACKLCA